MDNTSIESLKTVRNNNQDLLNFFNNSYISKLEQVQSLKSEEFELKAKIDQLVKTLDVYSFKTSAGHNVFSPFSVSATSQQEKATQIELQLKKLKKIQSELKAQIKEEEEETDLLKKRIANLSTSNKHLDELLSEITEEVSTINKDSDNTENQTVMDDDRSYHGINILKLHQYEKQQLAEKIQTDITEVLDSNSHKLEVLSWLIRSDINRAKVTLEELTDSTSKLADQVDELANSLVNEPKTDEPVWNTLEHIFQKYKDSHPECGVSYDINCTDYAMNIPDIVSTHLILIIEELMKNIFTHSSANKVAVKIYLSSKLIDVYINDNGVGIDSNYSETSPWYSGLHKIREIVYLLGGTFKITNNSSDDSEEPNGTNVRLTIPL